MQGKAANSSDMTPVLGEAGASNSHRSEEGRASAEADRQTESSWDLLKKPVLAEFLGTALFVFVGVLAVLDAHLAGVGDAGKTDIVALAHGFALFAVISVTAHVSGGHINPAVSWGVFLSGNLGFLQTVAYWIAQVAGGVLGVAVALGCSSDLSVVNYGAHMPAVNDIVENRTLTDGSETDEILVFKAITTYQAMFLEAFATSVLVLTVLCVAVDKQSSERWQHLAPLTIAMAVTTGIYAIGRATGGSMNPARSFGPAFISFDALSRNPEMYPDQGGAYYTTFWKYQWIYWLGPLAGATAASLIYRSLLASTKQKRPQARIIQ